MLERMKTHHINHSKVVEILFSNHRRFVVPINKADDLAHLLENLKYVKKIEDNTEGEWISLENLLSSDIERYSAPGLSLKGARLKERYTQAHLAKLLNIRQEELSKMERGKRRITDEMAKKIAKILKVDYRIFLSALYEG